MYMNKPAWRTKYSDYQLVLIPVPEDLTEIKEYLATHDGDVVCHDIDDPTIYLVGMGIIKSLTLSFKDPAEATSFYLRWNGYATEVS